MKLLITGGAGFIGSNFIYYMLKKYPSYKIVCLDALTYAGNLLTLKDALCCNNFTFVKGNILDKDLVLNLFYQEKFDVVINFAAETHVDHSIKDSSMFMNTNILGTQVLLDACRKYKVLRFHQISTDEVYGDLPIERKDTFFDENSLLRPSNPYSASKASADLLVLAYSKTHGIPATISRCSNNYGPYQHPEKLIPLMITHIISEQPLPVYGKGQNVRDWLYVEDHCAAIDLILHKGKIGQIYNVAGNFEKANIEVVKKIIHFFGKSESLISYVADRPGHDLRYGIDSNKIMRDLCWLPKTNFDSGIEITIIWYVNNKSWWNDCNV